MNITNYIFIQILSLILLQFFGIESNFIKSKYQELILFALSSFMGIIFTNLFFPLKLSVLQSNSEIEEKKDSILIVEGNPLRLKYSEQKDRSVVVTVMIEQNRSNFLIIFLYRLLIRVFDLSIYITTRDLKIQPKYLQDSKVDIVPRGIKIKLAAHLLDNTFLGINTVDPIKVTYLLDYSEDNLGEKRNYYIQPKFTLSNTKMSKFCNWFLKVLFHCKEMEVYKVYYKQR